VGVVKDSMAVYERAYPVYLQVYDEEEADVVEEDTFESVAHAERFFEENYDRQGVSAGVYELTTVFRSDSTSKKDEDLEDLKQQIKSLIARAHSAIATIDTALKERR
jgi:hypothetical protein